MKQGKLSQNELQKYVLDKIQKRRKEVKLSSKLGADCAVIDTDNLILITTDPITAECNNAGALAIHINANDIFASGGMPMACTMTIIIPPNTDIDIIGKIMQDAEVEADKLNIEIIGGHTEISDIVNRPFISCTMIGTTEKIYNNINDGDYIVMTKYACIEGSIILQEKINLKGYENDFDYFNKSLSVAEECKIASNLDISQMHDITEGGVFGAVKEMCSDKYGAVLDVNCIPIKEVTKALCNKIDINPYKTISSGSMLIVTSNTKKLIEKLKESNINSSIIGKINKTNKVIAKYNDYQEEIQIERDEIFNIGE